MRRARGGAAAGAPRRAPARGGGGGSARDRGEEQKGRRNRAGQLPKLRGRVMAGIEAAEARKGAIHERYADPTFYLQTSHDDIDALGEELAALGPKLDALMAEWEALEQEITEAASKAESQ